MRKLHDRLYLPGALVPLAMITNTALRRCPRKGFFA